MTALEKRCLKELTEILLTHAPYEKTESMTEKDWQEIAEIINEKMRISASFEVLTEALSILDITWRFGAKSNCRKFLEWKEKI